MKKFEIQPQLLQIVETIQNETGKGEYDIEGVEEVMVPMSDGVHLRTYIYVPKQGNTWPCILIRNPYPHNQHFLEACYTQFVEHGYSVVIQSCRGTGGSQGDWEPFTNERQDGIDTLQWLIKQPFQNGNIALFGQSYCSFTTWVMADAFPPEVKTVFLDLFGIDRYGQMYMNGMFRHDIYTSWAFANSGVQTQSDPGELYHQALKITPHNMADSILLGKELPFYQSYISESSRNSPYWQEGLWADLLKIPAKINIPVFMVEGWFDHHLEGAIKGYEQLSPEIKNVSRLVIGPWDHIGNSPGELDYPNANILGTARIKAGIEWFDIHLKGKESQLSPVTYYRIGANQWEQLDGYSNTKKSSRMYLSQAENLPDTGLKLTHDIPSSPTSVSYDYDPSNPIGTYGGSALLAWIMPTFNGAPHGCLCQPSYADRNDILQFDSEPLKDAQSITGKIRVKLTVSTDAEDTAFSVKILEVFSDGRAFNIVDGITSLTYRNNSDELIDYVPNEKVTVLIEMWPTAWKLQVGSKIRVEITSSNFPAYHVHSNIKGQWASIKEQKVAKQTVYLNTEHSYVELPD